MVAVLVASTKRYAELALNDEFDCYHDRKWQRVRVASTPVVCGDFVEFALCPLTVRGYKDATRRRFAANVQVEIYGDRAADLTMRDRVYAEAILNLLDVGKPAIRPSQIELLGRRAGLKLCKTQIKYVCDRLARRGLLVVKEGRYRRPIPALHGLCVVEHPNTHSEKYGWVDGQKFHQQTQKLELVIRWLDGSYSFSRDEWLEPLTPSWKTKWMAIAAHLNRGRAIDGLDLDSRFIHQLLRVEPEAFRSLAGAIGLACSAHLCRSGVMRWMEEYTPTWGGEAREH